VTTDNIQAYHNTISRTKKKQKTENKKQKQQPTQKINSKTRQPIHSTNQQLNCRTEMPQKCKKTPKTDTENGARTPKNGCSGHKQNKLNVHKKPDKLHIQKRKKVFIKLLS